MRNLILLAIVLTALWLGLSGLYKPLILGLGAVSVLLVLYFAHRFDLLDHEAIPYRNTFSILRYGFWLVGEIAASNARVIRACLASELDIAPTLVKIPAKCSSDLSKVIFANSITLTPGTVTVSVEGEKFLVHGLYDSDCEPEAFIEMGQRAERAITTKPAGRV